MAVLVANNPEAPVSRLILQPGINTLGRSEGNHHVIPHHSVSGRHCEIIVNNNAISVRDLGSTNGTFINDRQIQDQSLAHGERLKFGSVEYLLEAPEAPAPRSSGLRVNVNRDVTTVETADAPPVAHTASAAIASIRPFIHEEPSFYRGVVGAFGYPFNKSGILLLTIGSFFFLLLEVAMKVAFLFRVTLRVFTYGYLFAYMQRIVSASAQGEDELPDFPDITELWSDIVLPFLLFAGTFVVSFAPALAALIFMRESEWFWVGIITAVAIGLFYFPMALLAVAVTDNFFALSPHVVVPSIIRVFVPYLCATLVLGALVGVRIGVEFALTFVDIPILPTVVLGFISLYSLIVEMRILGLLFRSYRDRLGWLG